MTDMTMMAMMTIMTMMTIYDPVDDHDDRDDHDDHAVHYDNDDHDDHEDYNEHDDRDHNDDHDDLVIKQLFSDIIILKNDLVIKVVNLYCDNGYLVIKAKKVKWSDVSPVAMFEQSTIQNMK